MAVTFAKLMAKFARKNAWNLFKPP